MGADQHLRGVSSALVPEKSSLSMPQELRSLPRNYPTVVLRDFDRFGALYFNRRARIMEATVARAPPGLTKDEKRYMIRCETAGHVNRSNLRDLGDKEMI